MRYSSRFFLYAPFAGLLLLAAVAMIHWWIVASALAKHLDAVNGHEIMPGVRMSFSEKRLAGFPFRMDTILKNLRLETAEVGGRVVWTSEDFAMHALTYGRVQAIFEASGRQTLSWNDASANLHTFVFLPGTFRAGALLQDGKLIRFDAQIVDLDGGEFRAGDVQLHFRCARVGIDAYLKLLNAHISAGYAAALGPDLASLTASARLDHAGSLESLLRGEGAPEPAVENWRQSGGSIAVSELSILKRKEPLSFAGRLILDENHDLAGTLRGRNGPALQVSGNRLLLSSGFARP